MGITTGCSSYTQLTAAKTIFATQVAVDNAMTAYSELVRLKKVSLEDRIKVKDLYARYEELENIAIAGLSISQSSIDTLTPTEMADLAFELSILLLNLQN